jgi:hypothetical protein
MNMYPIAISTHLFDLNGDVVLQNVSPFGAGLERLSRRVNRQATLNQSAFLDDLGFSDSDRTIVVSIDDLTSEQAAVLKNIVRNHATVYLSKWDGCYNATLQTFDPDAGRPTLTLLIYSREDAL